MPGYRTALAVRVMAALGFCLLFNIALFAQDPNFYIYLGFGQSNMAGAGDIETQDKTVDARFQMMAPQDCPSLNRSIGKWYSAVPPLWGCPSGGLGPCDYFGRTMVQKLSSPIKVGVIVIGIPGCDIRMFHKTDNKGLEAYTYNYIPSKYNSSGYAWLVDLAKLAQKDGVIKGFLVHQGETMPDSLTWPQLVKSIYDSLMIDLKLTPSKIPLLAGEVLYKNAGGVADTHNIYIHKLPGVLPNSYIISASGLAGKDQYHFTAASERIFGARYADTMLMAQQKITNSKTTIPVSRQTMHPVRYASGAVWITLQESFTYTITGLNGVVLESGVGKAAQSVGSHIAAGAYFLSVTGKTMRFTEKIIRT